MNNSDHIQIAGSLSQMAIELRSILDGEDTLYALVGILDKLSYMEISLEMDLALGDARFVDQTLHVLREHTPQLRKIIEDAPNLFSSSLGERQRQILENAARALGQVGELGMASVELSEFFSDEFDGNSRPPRVVANMEPEDEPSPVRIKLRSSSRLSVQLLRSKLIPFLESIIRIQNVIHDIKGLAPTPIYINTIQQGSLNVELTGGKEAIELIRERVTKWRRDHAEKMAELEREAKRVSIEKDKAELLDLRAKAAKERGEADKISAEADLLRAQIVMQQIANRKAELELYRLKMQLVLDMINSIAPNLSEKDRLIYITRLLKPLDVLISIDLEITQ